MKLNKTLIILSLLLVFCISLGAVSAADNTDMSVNDTTDNSVATVESSAINEEINAVSDGKIHKSSEIYDEIYDIRGTYYITNDYEIDETWEIPNRRVFHDIIIEGNNHTIYGNGKQAFNIINSKVIIKNLNFVNCSGGSGGAIYFNGNNCSVSGCSFVGCSANEGGAVCWYTFVTNADVSGCSFVNCSSGGSSGAIYIGETGSVSGCSFVNCSANNEGGAIYIYTGSVSGCSFVNCSVSNKGGAIYTTGGDGSSIICCSFVNCSSGGSGGAIYLSFIDININYCTFYDCRAGYVGGAIYMSGGDNKINYCIFDNNKASEGKDIFGSYKGNYDFNFFSFKNDEWFPKHLLYDGTKSFMPKSWVVLDITNSTDNYFVKFVTDEGNNLSNSMPDYVARLVVGSEEKIITIHNNMFSCDYDSTKDYNVYSLNSGKLLCSLPNCTVTSILEDNTTNNTDSNTEDINNSVVSNKINNVTNMENCGTPLIALLIALISLPIIRRK